MPENWAGRVEVRSALDGRVANAGVARYRELAVDTCAPIEDGGRRGQRRWLLVRARSRASMCGRPGGAHAGWRGSKEIAVERRLVEEPGCIGPELSFDVARGRAVDRREDGGAVHVAGPGPSAEAGVAARDGWPRRAGRFDELLARACAGMESSSGAAATSGRAPPATSRCPHPAACTSSTCCRPCPSHTDRPATSACRPGGCTARPTAGHIFWDELFVFPFLNLRFPSSPARCSSTATGGCTAARARRARAAGYRGAMFPWQSGSDGREETPASCTSTPASGRGCPTTRRRQRHVNVAIAYNVWQYYQATGDRDFLSHYGAEMLLEIARFWASMPTLNDGLGRYEIRGVMGPDEYHDGYPDRDEPGLDNNAYTNVMAAWVLCAGPGGAGAAARPRRVELRRAARAGAGGAGALGRRQPPACASPSTTSGIISQFEGYERPARVRLGRLPAAATANITPPGPDPGGRGRLAQPLQARPSRPTC